MLVRETTQYICFIIYFAEIKLFQMYNSNSNAESKIIRRKNNQQQIKKKTHTVIILS